MPRIDMSETWFHLEHGPFSHSLFFPQGLYVYIPKPMPDYIWYEKVEFLRLARW